MNPRISEIIENAATSTEVDFSEVYELIVEDEIQLLAQRCPQLESLRLYSCSEEALEYLHLFPKLTRLAIASAWGLSRDGKWIDPVCLLSQLTHLTINCYEDVDSIFLQKLCSLKQLVSINLEAVGRICDEDLPLFSQFEHLRFLNLNGSHFLTDEGIPHLASLVKLEGLEMAHTVSVSDKGLQLLSPLHNLKYLNLRGTNISDEGLKSLSCLENLELLEITQCPQLTDRGLLYLKTLRKLHLICIGPPTQTSEHTVQQMPSQIKILENATEYEVSKLWDTQILKYQ